MGTEGRVGKTGMWGKGEHEWCGTGGECGKDIAKRIGLGKGIGNVEFEKAGKGCVGER